VDLAQINLLIVPQNSAKVEQLRQAVFSGEYGPPAVTIAEAMLELALARGLTVSQSQL
jgi:anti-sigma28 factor (negative regulator of flagellin synthesis)